MKKYTDGLEVIEAVRYTGGNFQLIWDAFGWSSFQKVTVHGRTTLRMRTADDQIVYARANDWIVPDRIPGTFYQIEPRTFKNNWKEVTDMPDPKPDPKPDDGDTHHVDKDPTRPITPPRPR